MSAGVEGQVGFGCRLIAQTPCARVNHLGTAVARLITLRHRPVTSRAQIGRIHLVSRRASSSTVTIETVSRHAGIAVFAFTTIQSRRRLNYVTGLSVRAPLYSGAKIVNIEHVWFVYVRMRAATFFSDSKRQVLPRNFNLFSEFEAITPLSDAYRSLLGMAELVIVTRWWYFQMRLYHMPALIAKLNSIFTPHPVNCTHLYILSETNKMNTDSASTKTPHSSMCAQWQHSLNKGHLFSTQPRNETILTNCSMRELTACRWKVKSKSFPGCCGTGSTHSASCRHPVSSPRSISRSPYHPTPLWSPGPTSLPGAAWSCFFRMTSRDNGSVFNSAGDMSINTLSAGWWRLDSMIISHAIRQN